ncbi:MAG: sulfatase-like hydrolase/transferase [Rubrivivax sp.]|nr:sulfatase-like hydrolase/transferase [Rubrivivax sp.]
MAERPGAPLAVAGALPAPRLALLLRCALAALVILWLPLALLQELDALLAYTAPMDLARDIALLLPLVAAAACALALLAWAGALAARALGRSAATQARIAWALLLVPAGWLCAWQITRSVRLWLQTTSGLTLSVGSHTRLVGIVLLLALVLVLWGRFGPARLGHRAIELLRALSAPSLALIATGVLVTLWMPPALRGKPPPVPAATPGSLPAAGPGRPTDVILISIDALAAEDAAVCGSGPTLMPRLRQLAGGATCFSRYYASSNFTTPTTSTMETGTLPWTHFATQIAAKLPASQRGQTMAAQLRTAGYRTHFITDNFLASPLHHGTWRGWDDQRYTRSLLRNRLREALTIFPDSTLPLLVDNLTSFVGALDVYVHAGRNPYDTMRAYRAIPGMLAANPGPALVWVHTMPPHAPYLPPPSTRHRLLPAGELEQWHEFMQENMPYGPRAQALVDKHHLRYRESIMGADESLGRLLDELQRLGRLDSALVIVTSDHGESFERNFIGHAGPLLHEAVIRVPLVVKLPGQTTSRIVETPVSQADLAPTVLDLVGARPLPSAEGRSLRAALEGQVLPPTPVFTMSLERQSRFKPLRQGHYAVIAGTDKLIWNLAEDRVELYDLQLDPHELRSIAQQQPGTVARLKALLRERIASAEAARTVPAQPTER